MLTTTSLVDPNIRNYLYIGTSNVNQTRFSGADEEAMYEGEDEPRECPVCGAEHDEGIHEATLSIHRWLHDQVTRYLFDPAEMEIRVA